MQILLSWLVLSVAVLLTAALLPGMRVRGISGALVTAALFGALNWLLGWLFFVVIGVATLGLGFLFAFLSRWLVNAIVLKMADALTDRLTIRSFGTAFIAAGLISLFGTGLEYLVRSLL
ncbi:MAG: hypothetical protein D6729_01990 [Deltaproteobacteria bacterium]|nr:MAG: hypothetical protein D6729_01990 [Deltaproteobacteria bacterium]